MSRKRYVITASTFDKKGRHIATGQNEYHRSHPLMKHFAVLAGESPEKCWKHAELSAVLLSGERIVDSMLVQRYDSYGNQKLARPCKTCQTMLKSFGIRIIRYTSDEGIKEELVEDM